MLILVGTVISIACLKPASFFVLFTVTCSFPLKITTMISLMAAALLSLKEPGGIRTAICQTSTDRIVGDNTTLLGMESIGTRFEDITIH